MSKEKVEEHPKKFTKQLLQGILKVESKSLKKKERKNHFLIVRSIIAKERIKMKMDRIEKMLRRLES